AVDGRPFVVHVPRERLAEAPATPGVYHLLDREGRLLYVGKALRLRERLASYFTNARGHSARVLDLIRHTHDFRTTETGSELAAALLEARQIRALKPSYNRQRKHLPRVGFLKLTDRGSYPRLAVTQRLAAALRFEAAGGVQRDLDLLEGVRRRRRTLSWVVTRQNFVVLLPTAARDAAHLYAVLGGRLALEARITATADLAAAVAFVRQRFAAYQDVPLRREEGGGTTILAARLRDGRANDGSLLPLNGSGASVQRLDELAVTVRDLRLPGPLPAIDDLA